MRVVRFLAEAGGRPRLGTLDGDEVVAAPAGTPAALEDVLAEPDGLATLAAGGGARHRTSDVIVLAPITRPTSVLCVGKNYPEHAAETGSEATTEPIIFSKLASSITGPTDPVFLPRIASERVDYEAELVVVIGTGGRDIPAAAALAHVAGYMAGNDVSARDWQVRKPGGQWLLGKSFDTFLPVGPALVTPEEIDDLDAVRIRCLVDGEELQDDVVGSMIFGVAELIAYVSQVATLRPGDLLLTGTPAGVGMARTPRRWLRPGEVMETVIDGVGTLRNTIRAAGDDAGGGAR